MSNEQQTDYQQSQLIEKEYINSMLNIDCPDAQIQNTQIVQAKVETINFGEAYTGSETECKVFDIEGINIALPSSYISSIAKQQTITLIEGGEAQTKTSQAGTCAGQIEHDGNMIKVINLASLIMNGVSGFECSSGDDIADVAILKGCSLGFTCNQTINNQVITKNQICWRDQASQRLWLAGTITELKLSLLDVKGLIDLLPD